jgi:hypothetical protein
VIELTLVVESPQPTITTLRSPAACAALKVTARELPEVGF